MKKAFITAALLLSAPAMALTPAPGSTPAVPAPRPPAGAVHSVPVPPQPAAPTPPPAPQPNPTASQSSEADKPSQLQELQAVDAMMHQALEREAVANSKVIQLQAQIADLQRQLKEKSSNR